MDTNIMTPETSKERQSRFRANMKGLGYKRVESWVRIDGADSREFGTRGKLALALALRSLVESAEKGLLTLAEFETARELWRPILGMDFENEFTLDDE
jgi:hypothetical protein